MEAEIPIALIRSFQSTAREQAGIPWYDPSDPAIPVFAASLREAVAEADSAVPPYLKCHQCRTALPRGLQSATCAHCGVKQHREIPLSLSFISTFAYQNLLQSLDLDGSEPVVLDTDSQKSSKGKDTVKSNMTLSNLLDLELRWPPERKETKTATSSNRIAQRNPPLNLSAADLDNFFIEKKTPDIHNANQLYFDSESFDIFQNLRSSDAVTSIDTNEKVQHASHSTHTSSNIDNFAAFEEHKSSSMVEGSSDKQDAGSTESFTDWQADFQSAGSGISLFHDSSVLDKNTLYNDKDLTKEAKATRTISNSNADDSQIPDDLWHTSLGAPPNKMKNGTMSVCETGYAIESSSFDNLWPVDGGDSSVPFSKNQNTDNSFDLWQDFSSSNVAFEARPTSLTQPVGDISTALNEEEDDEDSYDVWQDFSGSKVAFQTLPNSVTQKVATENICSGTSGNEADDSFDVWQDFSSSKCATKVLSTGEGISLSANAVSNNTPDVDFDDMEFSNFVQGSVSSEIATAHDSLTDRTVLPLQVSDSDRNDPMEIKRNIQYDVLAGTNQNELSNYSSGLHLPDSSCSSVDSLLSQMHDLSFMLKDDLSIPSKAESLNFPS